MHPITLKEKRIERVDVILLNYETCTFLQTESSTAKTKIYINICTVLINNFLPLYCSSIFSLQATWVKL